jgi:hypothetical protein
MSDTDNGCHRSDRVKGATGDFEIVVGLEVHARITASSKLFSGAARGLGADPIAGQPYRCRDAGDVADAQAHASPVRACGLRRVRIASLWVRH